MKVFATNDEPIVVVPVILEVVQVEPAVVGIEVEVADLDTVRTLPARAKMYKMSSLPPLFEFSQS